MTIASSNTWPAWVYVFQGNAVDQLPRSQSSARMNVEGTRSCSSDCVSGLSVVEHESTATASNDLSLCQFVIRRIWIVNRVRFWLTQRIHADHDDRFFFFYCWTLTSLLSELHGTGALEARRDEVIYRWLLDCLKTEEWSLFNYADSPLFEMVNSIVAIQPHCYLSSSS